MGKTIIEIAGEAVGALLPHANGFRFIAVKLNVWPLDGAIYADHQEARKAVFAHVASVRSHSPESDRVQ